MMIERYTRGRSLRDMLPHVSNILYSRMIRAWTSCVGALLARWWGVQLGTGVLFNGIPRLRRLPSSQITIGNRCEFSSGSRFNLIGIDRPCIISTLSESACIEIGEGSGFSGTVIGAESSIRLGQNVRCGANTLITDTDWHTDDYRTSPPKAVVIEDNVWLGVNVTVMKGVAIGENSLIGANSLVTRDIPPNVIAAGSPAVVIRKLPVAPEAK